MPDAALQLRSIPVDASLIGQLPDFERVGLDGALADAGFRMRRTFGRGRLTEVAYSWRWADEWSGVWFPQGVAVGDYNGAPLALVSWYAQQDRKGVVQGSRISVVDLRDERRPAYANVLLVSPRATSEGVVLDPVLIHAGGIAWAGDRLLVAATFDGIREFRLSDIRRAPNPAAGPFGYQLVLPEFGHHEPTEANRSDRMRYSFLTVETGTAVRTDASSLKLVAGEYSPDDTHRLMRFAQSGDRMTASELHFPRIPRMQGVAVHDDQWYVTSSHGENRGGDLWSGPIDNLRKRDQVLPPGPEALAVWPERNQLWSLSEVPGRRWLYAMDLAKIDAP